MNLLNFYMNNLALFLPNGWILIALHKLNYIFYILGWIRLTMSIIYFIYWALSKSDEHIIKNFSQERLYKFMIKSFLCTGLYFGIFAVINIILMIIINNILIELSTSSIEILKSIGICNDKIACIDSIKENIKRN